MAFVLPAPGWAAEPPRGLAASGWLLVEESSGDVLASHSPGEAAPIASATKLMTAYLAMRALDPGELVTAAPYEAEVGESLMGLEAGETVSARDLFYGLLVASGNDAATTLAIRVAGSIPGFVDRMNQAAASLGLGDTSYTDPIGLDEGNVSSARDLVSLAMTLREDPLFRRIVDTPRVTVGLADGPERLVNRNTLLLEQPFVDGVKTGSTVAAGYVLVASAEKNGVEFVSAVIGAPSEIDRDASTLALLRYGAEVFRARAIVAKKVERFETLARRVVAAARSAPERAEPGATGLPGWALVAFLAAGVLAAALAARAVAISRGHSR